MSKKKTKAPKQKIPKRKIHFILTGGTIDKSYDPATEVSVPNKKSIIPEYLSKVIQPHFIPSVETLCLVDSTLITDTMRRRIVKQISKTKAKHIIIVHGTSTMTKTASFVDKHLDKMLKKTVVLTGAMIPLKEYAMGDAGFNLGFAIGAMQGLKPGVYIAMNGHAFPAGKVTKNVKKARFEDA